MNPTDTELIVACIAGDRQAWNALVERYSRLVYSVARRRALDEEAAADVFQEVFLIVHRQLYSLQNHQALPAWLITITLRECRRYVQDNRRSTLLDEEFQDEHSGVEEWVRQWELEQLIRQALHELDPRCRELLNALFFSPEPATYAQITQRLGMPLGSIGPIRARCFKKFQAILKNLGYSPQQGADNASRSPTAPPGQPPANTPRADPGQPPNSPN